MSEHNLSNEPVFGVGTDGAVQVEGVVGGVAMDINVTDNAARILGIVSISGQPISVDVTDEPARQLGVVSITGTPTVDTELPTAAALTDAMANPTAPFVAGALMGWENVPNVMRRLLSDEGYLETRGRGVVNEADIDPAANTAGTITLTAAGAGLFHWITHLRFVRVSTAALAGGAILTITTTNLPGAPQWRVGNAMAAGATQIDMDQELVYPWRSSVANTNTTIVFPAPGAGVSWSCMVHYFISTASG